MKDQLDRASISILLDIAEGNGKFAITGNRLTVAAVCDVQRAPLQQLLQESHPVAVKNLLDFLVAKSTLDQFPRKIARV